MASTSSLSDGLANHNSLSLVMKSDCACAIRITVSLMDFQAGSWSGADGGVRSYPVTPTVTGRAPETPEVLICNHKFNFGR